MELVRLQQPLVGAYELTGVLREEMRRIKVRVPGLGPATPHLNEVLLGLHRPVVQDLDLGHVADVLLWLLTRSRRR